MYLALLYVSILSAQDDSTMKLDSLKTGGPMPPLATSRTGHSAMLTSTQVTLSLESM